MGEGPGLSVQPFPSLLTTAPPPGLSTGQGPSSHHRPVRGYNCFFKKEFVVFRESEGHVGWSSHLLVVIG